MADDVAQLLRRIRKGSGMTQRQLAVIARTSQAAIARYEAGQVLPDLRTLDRLLGACGHSLSVSAGPTRRTGRESAAVRPVAVPTNLSDTGPDLADGVVELPIHIRWSGPPRSYDMNRRRDRARVYEQVLREGDEHDVRRFVRATDLVELWADLVLPGHVRSAWQPWIDRHRQASRC